MIDDGDRVGATLEMIGRMALSTLHVLEKHDLLKPDSPIVNIGLVISLYHQFIGSFEDAMSLTEFTEWPNALTAYAEKHGIVIAGVYGITDGSKYPAEIDDEEVAELVEKQGGEARWCGGQVELQERVDKVRWELWKSWKNWWASV